MFDPKSNRATNTITGITTDLNAPAGGGANGAFGQQNGIDAQLVANDQPDPQTGLKENALKELAKVRPPGYIDQLRRIALADQEMPKSVRQNPYQPLLQQDIGLVTDNWKDIDHGAKKKFLDSATSGDLFKKVIAPAQKMINHGVATIDQAQKLGLVDNEDDSLGGGATAWGKNQLTYMESKIKGDGRAAAFDMTKKGVLDEFTKFMRGTGGMTDQSERMQQLTGEWNKANTPKELKAVMGAMNDLMEGQLAPIAGQYRINMKRPSATPLDLLGINGTGSDADGTHNARDNLAKMKSWANETTPVRAGGAAPAAAEVTVPAQPPAIDPAALAEAKRRGLIK
jgi:hypothetical protein